MKQNKKTYKKKFSWKSHIKFKQYKKDGTYEFQ